MAAGGGERAQVNDIGPSWSFCLSEKFQFLEVKFSIYLNRCVFVLTPMCYKASFISVELAFFR